MQKKANVFVGGFITIVLGVVLLAYVLFPSVRLSTQTSPFNEVITKTGNASVIENITLTHYPIDSASLTITDLTEGSNYTILNADTGLIELNNTENATTYTANYGYYNAGYLESSMDRGLMAIVILAGIIGLVYVIFKMFGTTD